MNVRFAPPLGILAWLPTSVLTVTEDPNSETRNRRSSGELGRARGLQGSSGATVGNSITSNLVGERARRENNIQGFGRRSGLQSGLGSGRGAIGELAPGVAA